MWWLLLVPLIIILICGIIKRVLFRAILCALIYFGVSYIVRIFGFSGILFLIIRAVLFIICLIAIFGKKRRRKRRKR